MPTNGSHSPEQGPAQATEGRTAPAEYTQAFMQGNALQAVARFTEAIACYDRAILLKPGYMEAHRNRANALKQLGRLAEAITSYDHAIALKPTVASYTNRGNVLRELRRTEEALESYERAIALNPRFAELHNNRGSALQELGRFEEAAASYQRAIALKPEYAEGHNNLGVALHELRRPGEAIAAFDRAIALKGDYAEALWNRSLSRLLTGQYASGWRDYEARKKKRAPVADRTYSSPLWLGEEMISGKTILVHWEQGFGDTIQFSRYVTLLADAGARVLFAPQRPLQRLMHTLDPRVQIVDIDGPLPAFDFHCPLMSLPLALATEARIPRAEGYLQVDPEKASAWRGVLGEKTRPFIGVAWSGSPAQRNNRARSIEFRSLAALFDDRYRFFSLQKDVSDQDRPWLQASGIVHLGDRLEDFADTAAVCSLMDLVVSVDTSPAHLAGALGIPAYVLLSYVPDWRWMLDRADSPWYSSVTLFRQPRRGDWDAALRQVKLELASRFPAWRGR